MLDSFYCVGIYVQWLLNLNHLKSTYTILEAYRSHSTLTL